MQKQRIDSIPILRVNITIDTMLKLDANADLNVNIDAQCERSFNLNPPTLP